MPPGISVPLSRDQITTARVQQLNHLNEIAQSRGQSLAQMAIAWLLKDPGITRDLAGVRNVEQLKDNLQAMHNLPFEKTELGNIRSTMSTVL